jgi:hypothetical protein
MSQDVRVKARGPTLNVPYDRGRFEKMKMGYARGFFSLIVATALTACGGGTSSDSNINGGIIGQYTVGQLATLSSPWGDGSAAHHPAEAVKFTPSSYPVTITSVTIYAKNNTGTDQLFNLYGYSDLASETGLFGPLTNQIIPDTGTSFIAKTVNIPRTTITSGDFYVAVEWVTKPLFSVLGTNSFFIITDNRLDFPASNFMRFSGTTWNSFASLRNNSAGDLGIIVNY